MFRRITIGYCRLSTIVFVLSVTMAFHDIKPKTA